MKTEVFIDGKQFLLEEMDAINNPPPSSEPVLAFVPLAGFYWARHGLNAESGELEWYITDPLIIGRGAAFERIWPTIWFKSISTNQINSCHT